MAKLTVENFQIIATDGRIVRSEKISFSVEPGEILVVRGLNGCGKTSLLKNLLRSTRAKMPGIAWAPQAERIAYLPQSADSQFHIPFRLGDLFSAFTGSKLETTAKYLNNLLTPEMSSRTWNQASGGEKKRALLASLLAGEPEIILLDEPLNHLDPISQSLIEGALRNYPQISPRAVIIVVSHHGFSTDESGHKRIRELSL